jgi:hypothetical protein
MIRTIAAYIVAPVLAAAGYRFTKECRWGTTAACRMTYRLVNTVRANQLANLLVWGRLGEGRAA